MEKSGKFQFSLKALILIVVSIGSTIGWLYDYQYNLHLTEVGRYQLTVDYDRSIEVGIAAGKYDYQDPDITSANFPPESGKSGQVQLEVIILGIDKYATAEEILKRMDRKGYRPATLQELLAFSEAYPDYQRQNWVVALDPIWQDPSGDRSVVVLYGHAGNRSASLDYRWHGWPRYYRFPAFGKDIPLLNPPPWVQEGGKNSGSNGSPEPQVSRCLIAGAGLCWKQFVANPLLRHKEKRRGWPLSLGDRRLAVFSALRALFLEIRRFS